MIDSDKNNHQPEIIADSSSSPDYKRKKKLIVPKLQLALVAAALLVFILASLVFFATIQVVFLEINRMALVAGIPQGSTFFIDLSGLENITASIYGLTILVSIILIFVGGIRLSHRIAGPIYYLNRHIEDVCAGRTLDGVNFRQGDFLLDLRDNFNKLMLLYRKKVESHTTKS